MSLTNLPNGIQTFLVESNAVYKDSNYVMGDNGKVFYSDVDGVVFKLPPITSGQSFTFINTANDGLGKLSISPNDNDGIMYAGSATDNKDLINTKLTAKTGDKVTIYNVASTDYWSVDQVTGIWEKEI